MNTDDAMISEIKELSKKLVDNNIAFPMEIDYFLIEQAMLKGASIAFQSILKKEAIDNEKLHTQITTKEEKNYV